MAKQNFWEFKKCDKNLKEILEAKIQEQQEKAEKLFKILKDSVKAKEEIQKKLISTRP